MHVVFLKFLATLVLTLVGAILYRLGGKGEPFNTKVRDIGVPAVGLILLAILGLRPDWWVWVVTFVASFGIMTTYYKFGGQEDVYWHNWAIVGFMFGLCMILFAWRTGNWLGFGLRTVLLTIAVPVWCEKVDIDWWEEGGRGGMFILTLPMLLIG